MQLALEPIAPTETIRFNGLTTGVLDLQLWLSFEMGRGTPVARITRIRSGKIVEEKSVHGPLAVALHAEIVDLIRDDSLPPEQCSTWRRESAPYLKECA